MSTTAAPTPPPAEPETTAAAQKESLPTSGRDVLNRMRTGDLGSLRVLVLLAIVWAIFQSQESRFLSSTNIVNLSLQITAVALISVGVVLVLLLGEIDLSVGAVSGVCAAIVAVLNVKHGWAPVPAIIAGVGVGAEHRPVSGLHLDEVRDTDVRGHTCRIAGLAGAPAQSARRDRHREPPARSADRSGRQLPGQFDRLDHRDRLHRPVRRGQPAEPAEACERRA